MKKRGHLGDPPEILQFQVDSADSNPCCGTAGAISWCAETAETQKSERLLWSCGFPWILRQVIEMQGQTFPQWLLGRFVICFVICFVCFHHILVGRVEEMGSDGVRWGLPGLRLSFEQGT